MSSPPGSAATPSRNHRNPWKRPALWCAGIACALIAILTLAGMVTAHRLEPMVRSRLLQTFQERFHSPASLDDLRVSYNGQIQVDGRGLRVQSVLTGVPGDPAHPMLQVQEFHFHMGLLTALNQSPRIHHVRIRGVQLMLPPDAAQQSHEPEPKHEVNLEYAEVDDVHIRFAPGAATRAPMQFDLPHTVFRGVSRSAPIRFHAVVDNGPPIGLTETDGTIGPWNFDDPRLTPLRGTFTFLNKDVSSVRGLRGHLTLHGRYDGSVGSMHAEGTTDHPDFALDVSSHPVEMHTKFAITLQPAQSNVALQRIEGTFSGTNFTCIGEAVKDSAANSFRLNVQLDAPAARLQDVLAVVTRTAPPAMQGTLSLSGPLLMRAGPESVSRKLAMPQAAFAVRGGSFGSPAVQQSMDELAERAQGDPKNATPQRAAHVTTDIHGSLTLRDAVVHFPDLSAVMPGAQAKLHGSYDLQGTQYLFDGQVRTDAKLSQMTHGVKRWVLTPFNHLLGHSDDRHGQGATLPLHIYGIGNSPHADTTVAGFRMKAPGTK